MLLMSQEKKLNLCKYLSKKMYMFHYKCSNSNPSREKRVINISKKSNKNNTRSFHLGAIQIIRDTLGGGGVSQSVTKYHMG